MQNTTLNLRVVITRRGEFPQTCYTNYPEWAEAVQKFEENAPTDGTRISLSWRNNEGTRIEAWVAA